MAFTCDASKFVRRMRATSAAMDPARREALQTAGNVFMGAMQRIAPRDTNRYANAWAMAANQAGCGNWPVAPLRPSSYSERAEETLDRQVQYWERMVKGLHRDVGFWQGVARRQRGGLKGGQRTEARKAEREYEKAVNAHRRAVEEREKFSETSVIIGLYTNPGQDINKNGKRVGRRIRSFAYLADTARYGGYGRIISLHAGGAVLELVNREPHARLVERKTRTMALASVVLKGSGVRRVSARYFKIIDAAQRG